MVGYQSTRGRSPSRGSISGYLEGDLHEIARREVACHEPEGLRDAGDGWDTERRGGLVRSDLGGWSGGRLLIAPSVVDIEGMAGQDFPFDPAFAAGTGQWTAVTVPLRDGADRAMIAFRAALVAVQGPWTLRMPAGQGRSRRNNGPGSRRAVRSRAPPAAYPRSIRHPARCMRIASRACSGCPSA